MVKKGKELKRKKLMKIFLSERVRGIYISLKVIDPYDPGSNTSRM